MSKKIITLFFKNKNNKQMVVFKCPRCGHEFDKLKYYNDHVNRTNLCKPLFQDIVINNTNYIKVDKIFSCEYCKKNMTTKFGLQRHIKNCYENPNNKPKIKQQEEKQQEQETSIIQFDKKIITTNSKIKFNTFDSLIKNFNDISEQRKGSLFEIYCKHVLLFQFKDIVNIWKICELPESIGQHLNIKYDKGIDLIVLYKNNIYKAVQCKFRTNIKKVFNFTDISTFIAQLYITNVHEGIFMSSVLKNCKEFDIDKIIKHNYNYFKELDGNDLFYNILFNDTEFIV
jgi:hypothetical protein